MIELKIVLEKGEDGYIVANCPALKGCWSQGKTEAEAIKNIREAIHLYLESEPESRRSPRKPQKVVRLAL